MDETAYLQSLDRDPDNADLRSAYLGWLEKREDPRGECMRLMEERMRLEAENQEINRKIHEIDWQIQLRLPRGSQEWLDTVYPLCIRSPLVGRFYTVPRPDVPPFVSVGDRVTPEAVVGIMECMKVFVELPAGIQGVISAVLVGNATVVEYNQLLFKASRAPQLVTGG
jgi:biotin carboxyl carrier protein